MANPLVNSYKRLIPGYDAPIYKGWASSSSQSCVLRIPTSRGDSTRIELRSPDSAMNPYLTLAAILAAGLDGIACHAQIPDSVTGKLYRTASGQKDGKDLQPIPRTLGEAIEAYKADPLIRRVLGDHIYGKYLKAKQEEWQQFRAQVTDWEIGQYLYKY